jgi:hypothetical protein
MVTAKQYRALAKMRQMKAKKGNKMGYNSIRGHGDYYLSGNVISTDSVPDFANNRRTTIVTHREYIADIVSSSTANTFLTQQFSINPGLSVSFPWLSTVAANYEEYRILGMVYELKSISSDALNSQQTNLGYVIAATQYNPYSPPFQSKQQMDNYEFAVSVKPSLSVMHPIECKKSEVAVGDLLFTRTGAVTGQDLRLYDWGVLTVATGGIQGTSVAVSELWCTYKIELLKPKIAVSLAGTGLKLLGDHYVLPYAQVTSTNYFGVTGIAVSSTSNMGSVLGPTGTFSIPTLANQYSNFAIIYAVKGNSTAVSPPLMNAVANCQTLNVCNNNSSDLISSNTTDSWMKSIGFFTTSPDQGTPQLSFSSATLPTSIVSADLYIFTIPYNN